MDSVPDPFVIATLFAPLTVYRLKKYTNATGDGFENCTVHVSPVGEHAAWNNEVSVLE